MQDGAGCTVVQSRDGGYLWWQDRPQVLNRRRNRNARGAVHGLTTRALWFASLSTLGCKLSCTECNCCSLN
jgi:hypothetical protein